MVLVLAAGDLTSGSDDYNHHRHEPPPDTSMNATDKTASICPHVCQNRAMSLRPLAIALLAACIVVWLAETELPASARAQSPHERIVALLTDDAAQMIVSPESWPDVSQVGQDVRRRWDAGVLSRLHDVARPGLSDPDRPIYDLLEYDATRRLKESAAQMQLTEYVSDRRVGPDSLSIVRAFGNPVQWRPLPSAGAVVTKLADYAPFVERHAQLLRQRVRMKRLPSAASVKETLSDIDRLLEEPIGTWEPLRRLSAPSAVDAGADTIERAMTIARSEVIPALQAFRTVLENDVLPVSRPSAAIASWPDAKLVYWTLFERATTTDDDVDTVQASAGKSAAGYRSEISKLLAALGRDPDVTGFLLGARKSTEFSFGSRAALISACNAALRQIRPALGAAFDTVPLVLPQVQPAHYNVPLATYMVPFIGSPQGRILIDVDRLDLRPRFEITTLMLHEGLPGHYLENAASRPWGATESSVVRAHVNEMRFSLGFTEGWGVYAERLGDTLGLFTESYDRIGWLEMQLLRATRTLVDWRVNVEGLGPAEASAFIAESAAIPEAMAAAELARTATPGVVASYQVGADALSALAARAQAAVGPRFNPRGLHRWIFDRAPLPLVVLRREFDQCLTEEPCLQSLRQ